MNRTSAKKADSPYRLTVLLNRWLQTAKKEWPKTLLQIVVGALGFLLALGINSWVSSRNENDTYQSMLKAVRTEGEINNQVLKQSYDVFYPNGIVLKEFSLTTTQQMMANSTFVKHAPPEYLDTLVVYIRDLSLANGYRRVNEQIQLSPTPYERWLDNIKVQWDEALNASRGDVTKVLAFR